MVLLSQNAALLASLVVALSCFATHGASVTSLNLSNNQRAAASEVGLQHVQLLLRLCASVVQTSELATFSDF